MTFIQQDDRITNVTKTYRLTTVGISTKKNGLHKKEMKSLKN